MPVELLAGREESEADGEGGSFKLCRRCWRSLIGVAVRWQPWASRSSQIITRWPGFDGVFRGFERSVAVFQSYDTMTLLRGSFGFEGNKPRQAVGKAEQK